MSKIFIISVLLFSINVCAQTFDVRGTKWNDTMEDVVKSEYPLEPNYKESEISYNNVNIGEDTFARIIYTFTNGKLSEVRYIIYGSSRYTDGIGTCKNQVALYNRYVFTSFVFEALKSKGYNCYVGWHLSGGYPAKNIVDITGVKSDYNSNCSFNKAILDKLDLMAKDTKASRTNMIMENNRSKVSIDFNNPLNSETNKCNSPIYSSEYFNTYFWLVFTPNHALQKEILKSGF